MCGIFGYIGTNDKTIDFLLNGLDQLSHRGYDSMGVAVQAKDGNGEITVCRKGKDDLGRAVAARDVEQELGEKIASNIGIAHTRWATFGKPFTRNAHPHCDQEKTLAIVHNGNVDNAEELNSFLVARGFEFRSETDTEKIANLISFYLRGQERSKENVSAALQETFLMVEGANVVLLMLADDKEILYACGRRNALIIYQGNEGAFISSDPCAAPLDYEKSFTLESNKGVFIKNNSCELFSLLKEDPLRDDAKKEFESLSFSTKMEKEIFPHHLLRFLFHQVLSFHCLYGFHRNSLLQLNNVLPFYICKLIGLLKYMSKVFQYRNVLFVAFFYLFEGLSFLQIHQSSTVP
jgi:glucosamine--fructose-6-phosphate aminotransferase (isomerizing)